MWEQIQLIPTPVIWVARPRTDQEERIGAVAATIGIASADYVLVLGADQTDQVTGLGSLASGGYGSNGDVNISGSPQSESPAALAGSGTANWDAVLIFGANQTELTASLAGDGTANWLFIFVFGPNQTDNISVLAGSGTANNGP